MKIAAYVLVLLGTLIGGFTFLDSLVSATSAPQQAAGAAMAIAWCVLPYCFARAIEKMGEMSHLQALERYFGKREPEAPPIKPVYYPGLTAPMRKPTP